MLSQGRSFLHLLQHTNAQNLCSSLSLQVVDLCCGKALFASLSALLLPHATVHAVDKRPEAYVPHFAAVPELAGRVTYARLDVLRQKVLGVRKRIFLAPLKVP